MIVAWNFDCSDNKIGSFKQDPDNLHCEMK